MVMKERKRAQTEWAYARLKTRFPIIVQTFKHFCKFCILNFRRTPYFDLSFLEKYFVVTFMDRGAP